MTNAHFFILLGSVLAGVVWQRVDVIQLTGRIDRMGDDLRQFYQILGRHGKAIEMLEKRPG